MISLMDAPSLYARRMPILSNPVACFPARACVVLKLGWRLYTPAIAPGVVFSDLANVPCVERVFQQALMAVNFSAGGMVCQVTSTSSRRRTAAGSLPMAASVA